MFQAFNGGQFQRFAAQYATAVSLVMLAKYGPRGALCIVGQEKPIAVAAGQVNGGMAPLLRDARRGCPAGFREGVMAAG